MTYGTGIDIRDVLPMTAGSDLDAFNDALARLRESMQKLFNEIDNAFGRSTASNRQSWAEVDAFIAEVREWTRDARRASMRLAVAGGLDLDGPTAPTEARARGRVLVAASARRSLAPRRGLRARRYGWRRGRA